MSEELVKELERQEQELVFTHFDNEDAWWLGSRLVEMAAGRPVAIDIRRGTQQLFHAALPGAVADNDRWIERKVRVVERFGASSYLVGRRLALMGRELGAGMGLDPADYAAHGGAFPVRIRNVGVVAVVTVSGLPQADDHALVVSALERFRSER
ncbi:heme-degrading domain-containing protein [Actinoplanes subtropicus]|uniref:heme-degrading domain-containing protein n=1 Tax=Actinoplanes subtropicus TaxID=543632 RepID=UPI0004C32F32|nr:heme-degrading domain-containing protein [Actinoplanes subtropicus]